MAKLKETVKKYVKDFAFEEIYANLGKNYRHAWKYKVEPKANYDATSKGPDGVPGFFEDIIENGIQTNIEVSLLTSDQIDSIERETGIRYKVRVIRGHRRWSAANLARELYSMAKFDRLTCLVYEGLNLAEETALKFDHKGIEQLDEYELYNAIIDLRGTGKSQEWVATQVGVNRNTVQDRYYIFELPDFVRANFEKKHTPLTDGTMPKKGKDYIHVTSKNVDEMHALMATDKANGIDSADPKSKVSEYWGNLVNKTKNPPESPNVKSLAKKAMDGMTGFFAGCDALEAMHEVYSGEGGNIQTAVAQYKSLESQANLVPALKSKASDLESRVAELEIQVAELTALLDQKEEELLALRPSNGHTNGVYQDAPADQVTS